MSAVTAAQLIALSPGLKRKPERAVLFADVLSDACEIAKLNTARRICHFMGQIAVETGGFASLVESTSYRDPVHLDRTFTNVHGPEHARRLIAAGREAIGNTIYAGRNGNGDVASGDGFRYRGRGFMQVTGRANYRDIGELAGMALEDRPELLGEPQPAAEAAAIFWRQRGINRAADANDLGTVTLLVNGKARMHMKERGVWREKAAGIWTDAVVAAALPPAAAAPEGRRGLLGRVLP